MEVGKKQKHEINRNADKLLGTGKVRNKQRNLECNLFIKNEREIQREMRVL